MARLNRRAWRVVGAAVAICAVAAALLWLVLRPCGWGGSLGRPGFDDPIASLTFFRATEHDELRLWVGGYFMKAHDAPAVGAATWDEERWAAAGPFNGPVRAMLALDDDASEGRSRLIAAGQFTQVRGMPRNYIASFDGERWSSMAGGFGHWATAVALFDNGSGPSLFAGGRFTHSAGGDTQLRYLARWTGKEWTEVGGGLNGPVHALHVCSLDGELLLVAAGEFTRAGGIEANRIAAWNGREWIDLGGGFDAPVLALTSIESGPLRGLYAGGRFTHAGGCAANRVARWDDEAGEWRPLGDGVDQDVYAMVQLGESLVVGGRFLHAGGREASRIARWDGGERGWSRLGPGTDGPVHTLLVDPHEERTLYVGGNFTRAGRGSANHLAVWRDCRP